MNKFLILSVSVMMLMACGDDSSPSASQSSLKSTSVDYRAESKHDLITCSEELDGKIAYVDKDSTWLSCQSYKEYWTWRRLVNVDGNLYAYGEAPAGSYDCNVYKCVSTEYLNPNVNYGEFLDKRDNKVYKTVRIGNQLWMAQNLVYTDGSDSLSGANLFSGDSLKKGAYYLAGNPCPEGWINPTRDDIAELVEFTGDTTLNVLKSSKESWIKASELTDPYGFSLVKSSNITYLTEDDDYKQYQGLGLSRGTMSSQGASLWLERNTSYQTWYVEVNDFDQKYYCTVDAPYDRYKTVRCIAQKGF
jgi:uncharacterized protein (TIGR02145 family)